jgi:hypothetical protein
MRSDLVGGGRARHNEGAYWRGSGLRGPSEVDGTLGSGNPVKWVVPAWEVLAADRGVWLKRLEVNGSEVGVC